MPRSCYCFTSYCSFCVVLHCCHHCHIHSAKIQKAPELFFSYILVMDTHESGSRSSHKTLEIIPQKADVYQQRKILCDIQGLVFLSHFFSQNNLVLISQTESQNSREKKPKQTNCKFYTGLFQRIFYTALYIMRMSQISKLFQWTFHQIMFTITERLDLQRNELTFQHSVAIAVFSVRISVLWPA